MGSLKKTPSLHQFVSFAPLSSLVHPQRVLSCSTTGGLPAASPSWFRVHVRTVYFIGGECWWTSADVQLQSTHSSKGPEWLGTVKRRRQPEFSRPPFTGAWSVRVPVRHVKQVRIWWVIPVPVKIKANSWLDCILCHDKTFVFALLVLLKFVPFYVIYFCRLFGLFFFLCLFAVQFLVSFLFSVVGDRCWWWCWCCSLLRAGFWVH